VIMAGWLASWLWVGKWVVRVLGRPFAPQMHRKGTSTAFQVLLVRLVETWRDSLRHISGTESVRVS